MPVKLRPSEVSRCRVQVELRDSTSISPDCSAVNRSLVERGVNLTLLGSLKIAAAMARHRSTSRPVQLPRSSGLENPGSPWVTPQIRDPRCLTVLSVCADADAPRPSSAVMASMVPTHFMTAIPTNFVSTACRLDQALRVPWCHEILRFAPQWPHF